MTFIGPKGTDTKLLESTHNLMCMGTQGKKRVTPEESGPDLPASDGGSPTKTIQNY